MSRRTHQNQLTDNYDRVSEERRLSGGESESTELDSALQTTSLMELTTSMFARQLQFQERMEK